MTSERQSNGRRIEVDPPHYEKVSREETFEAEYTKMFDTTGKLTYCLPEVEVKLN